MIDQTIKELYDHLSEEKKALRLEIEQIELKLETLKKQLKDSETLQILLYSRLNR